MNVFRCITVYKLKSIEICENAVLIHGFNIIVLLSEVVEHCNF